MLLVLLTGSVTKACDVCSAGASAMSLPGGFVRESQVGLSWQDLQFRSLHFPSILKGQEGLEKASREQFQVLMLQSRYMVGKRFQLLAGIPLQRISRKEEQGNTVVSGMGDINLGAAWFANLDSLYGRSGIQLQLEYQLKMPTGEYSPERVNETGSRFMLPGTGSWDHFLQVGLQKEVDQWVFRSSLLYRINGKTSDGLDWGNRGQFLLETAYVLGEPVTHRYLFSLGWLMEWGQADYRGTVQVPFSTYSLGQLKASVMWRYSSFALGGQYFQPVHGEIAGGRVTLLHRYQLHGVFFF